MVIMDVRHEPDIATTLEDAAAPIFFFRYGRLARKERTDLPSGNKNLLLVGQPTLLNISFRKSPLFPPFFLSTIIILWILLDIKREPPRHRTRTTT